MDGRDTIVVSANEVLRTTEWILRARGVDCGSEDVPARAVSWLALAQPSALDMLLGDLEMPDAVTPPSSLTPHRVDRTLRIDADGRSAMLVFPLIADWHRVCAPGETIVVSDLVSPMWCLGHLGLANEPGAIDIVVRDSRAPMMMLRRADDGRLDATYSCAYAQCLGRAFEITIAPAEKRIDVLEGEIVRLEQAQLQEAREAAIEHGLELRASLWRQLTEHAYRAFVPESETSRARGAGGGDDNV